MHIITPLQYWSGVYCDEYVCLSVHPHTYLGNQTSELNEILPVTVARSFYGWQHCYLLCTSMLDDVMFMFCYNGPMAA